MCVDFMKVLGVEIDFLFNKSSQRPLAISFLFCSVLLFKKLLLYNCI